MIVEEYNDLLEQLHGHSVNYTIAMKMAESEKRAW